MNWGKKARVGGGLGFVSTWGEVSAVQSIHRGTIEILSAAPATATATLTPAVDPRRSVLTLLGYSWDGAHLLFPTLQLSSDGTTVTLDLGFAHSGTRVLVGYEVLEYRPGVLRSVQHFTMTIPHSGTPPGTASATATLSEAVEDPYSLQHLGQRVAALPGGPEDIVCRLALTAPTTVTATREVGSGLGEVTVSGLIIAQW